MSEMNESVTNSETCSNCEYWNNFLNRNNNGICSKLKNILTVHSYNEDAVDYIETPEDFYCSNFKIKNKNI